MTKDIPTPTGPEVYRGNANAWECDEMGHMNVRFYVTKNDEAVQVLLARLGLPPARQKELGARALVEDYHIRFLGEVHPGAGLYAHGGVLEATPDQLRLFIDMRHAVGGALNATFNVVVKLRSANGFVPFPGDILEACKAHQVDLPPFAAPRSLSLGLSTSDASLKRADELGLHQINLGLVTPHQCDEAGELRGEWFMGRVSDGIGNLIRTFNPDRGKKGSKVGGAALEYRIIIHRRPNPGDVIAVRSGLAEIGDKTFRMGHWMVDLVRGDACATMEAAAASFDIIERKIIPIDDARRAHMQSHVKQGLEV